MMSEAWMPVAGWPYDVSSEGRVRRTRPGPGTQVGRVIAQRPTIGGYMRASMSRGAKQQSFLVHRLVLEAFVGPCPDGCECRHVDGDPTNNRLSNLIWGTHVDNIRDRDGHGRTARGEFCGTSKLNAEAIEEIRSSTRTKYLAQKFGVDRTTIQRVRRGVYWIAAALPRHPEKEGA